jgi:tripartite-type tricarboxylate transporter receptor subunit TctC
MKSWLFKAPVMLLFLLLFIAASTAPVFAADTYPSKPVRIIVANAPGGSVDNAARLIATNLSKILGKQVIVENHAGAGGVIGSEMAAKAAPDGHTLLLVSAFFTVNPAFYKLPFDSVKSFTPIARVTSGPSVIVTHPGVPAKSVQELIALAKQKPNQLIWAVSGAGTNQHLGAELFKLRTGTDIKILQFKGGNPALTDVLGGHSHIQATTVSTVAPLIKANKLRGLAVCGPKRNGALPDVPTSAEAGLRNYEVGGWFGLVAPAGTPAPIIDRLNKEIKTFLTWPDVEKAIEAQGSEEAYLGPAEFGRFIETGIADMVQVVKEAKIKLE